MEMEMGKGLLPNWASGIFLLQAVEQQGSSLQTKSSLGRNTGSSHSHSRLNTLKIFLVAANSKLNCNQTAVFPPLKLARQTSTARSGLPGCFPPSSPRHESSSSASQPGAAQPGFPWARAPQPAPCTSTAETHTLLQRLLQGLRRNRLLTAAFEPL